MHRPWLAWTMPRLTGTGARTRVGDVNTVVWSFKGVDTKFDTLKTWSTKLNRHVIQ